ncbi:MAG: aminotransferase class IV, partial [Candidatus Peregrinibacteria bacterium]
INGKIVPEAQAKIPVTSEAFLFGRAVFETIRTYNHKVFRLADHLGRLFVSAEIMQIRSRWTVKKAYESLIRTLSKSPYKASKIRVILTRHNLIVTVEKLKEKSKWMYERGVKLVSYPGKRNTPRAKNLSDSFAYLAKRHAEECGAYEALLVEPGKTYIRECAYANVFWIFGGKLFTTNKEILFGITRETVAELAGKLKIDCKFEGIKYKSLLSADEVFITQTTSGILPVIEIDGQKIGTGRPGPITKKLMKAFSELVLDKKSRK